VVVQPDYVLLESYHGHDEGRADPPRTEDRQRLSAHRPGHAPRLPRSACHAVVRVRIRTRLHDVRIRRVGPRPRRGARRWDGHRVRGGHQHRRPGRRRGGPALLPRHRDGPHPARPGTRRVPADPPRSRRHGHRRVHGPDEPARLRRARRCVRPGVRPCRRIGRRRLRRHPHDGPLRDHRQHHPP
jgi:hypothetical protein